MRNNNINSIDKNEQKNLYMNIGVIVITAITITTTTIATTNYHLLLEQNKQTNRKLKNLTSYTHCMKTNKQTTKKSNISFVAVNCGK